MEIIICGHFIRNIFVWLVSVFGIVFLYRRRQQSRGPLVRVLCFHDVPDRIWFEKTIAMLTSTYHVVSPEEFHRRHFVTDKINILLTFDDGYQSWTDIVSPVLKQYSVQGLFFVCSGLLDIADNKDAVDTFVQERLEILPKNMLLWDGVLQLSNSGHTIGGHTRNHLNLTLLELPDMKSEIQEDRERIEEKLGGTVRDFAYPFGTAQHINEEVRAFAHNAGYNHAYSAESSFYSVTEKDIPRTLVDQLNI